MPDQSDWAEICFLSLELMTLMTRFWFKKPQEIVSNAFWDAFNFEANALSTHPHHEPCLASVQGAVQKNNHRGTKARFRLRFHPRPAQRTIGHGKALCQRAAITLAIAASRRG